MSKSLMETLLEQADHLEVCSQGWLILAQEAAKENDLFLVMNAMQEMLKAGKQAQKLKDRANTLVEQIRLHHQAKEMIAR